MKEDGDLAGETRALPMALGFLCVALLLVACPAHPKADVFNFTGVWSGDAGPDPNSLKFQAKIEIEDDGGTISGEFFNEDPQKPGLYLRTGQIRGTRDGGMLVLTSGTAVDLPDAGRLEPQPLLLTYQAGLLIGVRVLQAPGRPPVNEYLILHKE